MKKVLITGASGLIGYDVIQKIQDGRDIYATSRDNRDLSFRNTQIIHCDLNKKLDSSILPKKVDAIIHLAQSEHFRQFPDNAEKVLSVNTLTTLYLLDYARKSGVKNFIYASSGGVYGFGNEGFTEDNPITLNKDLGFYIGTKLCSEIIAENYMPFMNIIILRFFFVYGPRQNPSMLIPRLVNFICEKKPIIFHGHDGIRINPTYVSDAAEAVARSLSLGESQTINVAGPGVLSMRRICEIIGDQLGIKPVFEILEGNEPRNLIGDIKKMSRLLSPPQTTFEEGITTMIQMLGLSRQ